MNDDDLARIDRKLDNIEKDVKALMIFMAIEKASTAASNSKKSRNTAAIVAVICSVTSSGIMLFLTKLIGG